MNRSWLFPESKSLIDPAAVSIALRRVAQISFGGLIITLPIRYRLVLIERPYPEIYREYSDVLLYASDVFMVLTVISWVLSFLIERKSPKIGPFFLTWPLIGLLGISFISVFFSVDPFLSAYNAVRLILLTLLYLFIVNECRSLSSIILPTVAMTIIQCSVGISQVFEQTSLGLGSVGELELNPGWSGVSVVAGEGIRWLRAYGLTDHPNILGGCLAWSMLVLLTWASSKSSRWIAVLAGVFGIASIGLFLTFSRAAWLAFFIAVLAFYIMLMRIRLKKPIFNSMSVIIASLILLIPYLWSNLDLLGIRFNFRSSFENIPQENQSIGERLLLNQAGNKIFSSNPVTGIGLSAFPVALSMTNPDFPVDYQPAHFVLLDVAVETGIFGALIFAILIIVPWFVLWIDRRNIDFSPTLIGVSCLLIAVTALGFFDYYPWLLAPGRLLQWISWGLWGAFYQNAKR